jgi:hypothetical protein
MKPMNSLRSIRRIGLVVTVFALGLTFLPFVARSQNVRSEEETARIMAIENLAITDGVVSGELRNKSNHAVRDVQLFLRYTWLWEDERHPGKTDPGTSTYYTLKETIQPGAKTNFTYRPSPPLPKISGGRFDTSVTIAGFTEIIPQTK